MRTRVLLVSALVLGIVGLGAAQPAPAASRWASASRATIHPGVQMVTAGAQCTASFVFVRGTDVLLGYAAHCAARGEATDLDGCTTKSLPLGTKVAIQGATRPGRLVYSSWRTMQRHHERNQRICLSNDFALVRIDPVDVKRVNPSIPHWGGPTGLATTAPPAGSDVYGYGNSRLRLGLTQLSPKQGTAITTDRRGWSHVAYMVTPGIPGDSGSALLNANGRATGVLSSIGLADRPASNRYSDLRLALYYASAKGFSVTLVKGTRPFNPDQLPLDV